MDSKHAHQLQSRNIRNRVLDEVAEHFPIRDQYNWRCNACEWHSTDGLLWSDHIRALKDRVIIEREGRKQCPGCPACPIQVRDLFAAAHNLCVTPITDPKFSEKIEELRESVRHMQGIIDKHFGEHELVLDF